MSNSNKTNESKPGHYILSPESEPFLERLFFNNRRIIMLLLLVATVFLGWRASMTFIDARIEKLIPLEHPYIVNYMENRDQMNLGVSTIKLSVETTDTDIFNKDYMETLRLVNDEVFFINGVDRSRMRSLWTSSVRWLEVTEEGFTGGEVIPSTYDGSDASLEQLRQNILKSGEVGRLVANNFKSTVLEIPLYELDPDTGLQLDYQTLSHALEERIRNKYSSDTIKIHMIGLPKKLADLSDGAKDVALFFVMAVLITMVLLFIYSRCFTGTLIPLICSLIAVIWQLGILNLMGFGVDPYSMLVPFLVFAIGVSHGVQLINGIAIQAGKGAGRLQASKLAFRSLYVPGMLALISDAFGFLTLLLIDINVISELAIAAGVGVAVIIITNLMLLPILMSYVGMTKSGIRHATKQEESDSKVWRGLSIMANRKVASVSILLAMALTFGGFVVSQDLQVGDLDDGAPELRADSVYNLDNKFITQNYSTSSDVLVIMVKTAAGECTEYKTMDAIDRFTWEMENLEGVQSAVSMVTVSKLVTKGMNEGSIKWSALSRNQTILNTSTQRAPSSLINPLCSLAPVIIFLNDHKAKTLERAVIAAQAFADENNNDKFEFLLASGNAGIEAATNEVIDEAQNSMLYFVYGVVILLCLATFRSLAATICIVVPLAITSVLSQALMTHLGIGVKVATLPVIALGVGIGVDYGIYIYTRLEAFLTQGKTIQEAYYETLRTTGKAVLFTGLTLAIGVGTWYWSPIKFQGDMGLLLAFMFIWNMVGALWLLPALASFLINPEKIVAKHQKENPGVDVA
jgi:predicted RND superfamily exporter protein